MPKIVELCLILVRRIYY